MDGDRLGTRVPVCDTTDVGALEAFYGNYGFCEIWRKIVLANAREMVRATAALKKIRLSEARIDDLARTHDTYLGYLATHLDGRRLREKLAREPMGLR